MFYRNIQSRKEPAADEQGKAENLACALSEHVVALIASYSASVI